MNRLIIALLVFVSINNLVRGNDKYRKVFETIGVFKLDLNHDGNNDSIILEKIFYINIENNKKTDDSGDFHKITFIIDNNRTVKLNEGGWVTNDLRHKEGDSVFNIQTNLFFTLKLTGNRIGLVFNSYPYASDPDKYTIYSISENSEIKTVYDEYFNITAFEDINSDGVKEIIGPIGYYGEINPDNTFVPYLIYSITDTFEINENLSYMYNLKLKKYRDFPEVSIRVISEAELRDYDKKKLRIMRNEIYADYGYIFKSEDLRNHFESKSWYKPSISSAEKITFTYLTDYEKKNIELIKKLELE